MVQSYTAFNEIIFKIVHFLRSESIEFFKFILLYIGLFLDLKKGLVIDRQSALENIN